MSSGVYDLLILPPSFPFGGMENPCLTFVTPSLLAGDRSLANVIVHEITHSWTGNLVTNDKFENFWLNEGFTTFVERKLTGKMYGEKMRHLEALEGLQSLKQEVKFIYIYTGADVEEGDDAQWDEIKFSGENTNRFVILKL